MLQVLEDKDQIAAAQAALLATVRKGFKTHEKRTIGFQGEHRPDQPIETDGTHWFSTGPAVGFGDTTPRQVNWFGRMQDGALSITVAINVPYVGASTRAAGYFARDPATGVTWLMHTGRIGGAGPGAGKDKFRAWRGGKLLQAADAEGHVRDGYAVMPVHGGQHTVRSAVRYIEDVAAFKEAAREGELETAPFTQRLAEYRDYFEESSGRRTGRRSSRIDYVSRHGEVVAALRDWREAQGLEAGEEIVKSVYLDLGVRAAGEMTEVYEVKTDASRSSVHSGLGQLLVQSTGDGCAMSLVLPEGEALAADLGRALDRLKARVIRFTLDAAGSIMIA